METITKSPTKRRALAALDANALASPKPPLQLKSTAKSPVKQIKRPLEEPMAAAAMSPLPKKRACFEVCIIFIYIMIPPTCSFPTIRFHIIVYT